MLEKVAVSQPVALDYQRRVKELKQYAKKQRLSLKGATNFDQACCKFVNHMFNQGFDLQDGSKTLAAIMDAFPAFSPKHMLSRTRRALQGWGKLEPQQTRPPVPWLLIQAISMELLKKNKKASAAAILLMFTAYLRPGEALDVQRRDLVPPLPGSKHYSLHLHPAERAQQSKVGLSDESILLDSPVLPWIGDIFYKIATDPIYLLDITYDQLVGDWKRALKNLGLAENHAVLYQLRHAGPSHDRYMKLRSLPEVKQRGRWAADSSVRRYEAHARISQEFHALPKQTQRLCWHVDSIFLAQAPRLFRQC